MRRSVYFVVLSMVASSGCSSDQPHERVVTLPEKIVVSQPASATQRFIPTNTGDLAFDTETGTLCRTWDWSDAKGIEYGTGIGSRTSTCERIYQTDLALETRAAAR